MRKFSCIFSIGLVLCYGGFSSGSALSEDTILNHTHQLIGFQSRGDALGWLEITKEAKAPITLKVAPLHLQVIQPIWSIDKDSQTSLSAFGIANLSSYEVNFDTKSHSITFPSIATMTSSSYSSGIYQASHSLLNTWGNIIFGSISHQGVRGSAFGVLGGRVRVQWGEVSFGNITSEYKDSYGVRGGLEVMSGAIVSFERVSAGGSAYGVEGELSNQGEIRIEEIRGGDQKLGFSGNAVGLKGKIDNQGSIEIALIGANNGGYAYGVSGEVSNQGEIKLLKITSSEGNAFGVIGGLSGGGRLEVGEILAGSSSAGGNAYGIYNLYGGKITNNATFSLISSIRDMRGEGGKSFGVYSLGDLEIVDSNLVFSAMWGEEIYPIFSQGALSIENSSLVFGAEKERAIISFEGGEIVLYKANLVADSGKGIVGSGSVRVLSGGEVVVDTPQNAFEGKVDIVLEEGATLMFGSDSQMKSLKAKHSTIKIHSKSATLDIYDFNVNHSSFVLASSAKTSDKIYIHSTTSTTPLKNNLYVKLNEVSTIPNYVLLVHLPKELGEKIIFNELYLPSSQSRAISYVGFDEVEVAINRHDSEESVYYYTDLVAQNLQINSSFLLPTQTALNANHSLFLLHLNSLDTRLGELRGGSGGNGVWGRVNVGKGREALQKESKILFSTYQGGYDYGFCMLEACDFVGVFGSYLLGVNTQEGGEYEGESVLLYLPSYDVLTQGFEVGVYNTYVRDRGFFADSVFKVSGLFSDIQTPLQSTSYALSSYALSLSQEMGYRFLLGGGVYFDLQTGVAGSFLTSQNFNQELELEGSLYTLYASQKELWILRARGGGRIGYEWRGEEIAWGLSVGGLYEYHSFYGGEIDYLSNSGARAKSNPYTSNQQGILSVGMNVSIKESSRLYMEFEKSFGGKILRDFSLNFGARFALGKAPQGGRGKEEQL
ncbi:autotransporter outer membrane beta-barrel domain-containing protein [Helicobacter brantae]|uniref:Autotransporter domain-containing protein n=1 Tax=Helicobacter brantae TaxID=375927 RepID=A0A3D8IZE2_9HELI|nr:autotransporter outer membrane beta-barrel domain-containing protein [Helicobacter brantae]RDU70443.1 hypothetical protein CQA58_05430 [Helicobacter brantae]